jgi:hypothetical protein
MKKSLIKSTVFCFLISHQAAAMAPAASCDPSLCSWLAPWGLSDNPDHTSLVLKAFPSDGIENFMPAGRSIDNGIPSSVEGIWWMDFNQEGDILVTFGTATWDAASRTASIPVYGERTYSFHATEKAAKSYAPLLATHYTYVVRFNDNFDRAEITPKMRLFGRWVTIPEAVAHFTMRYSGDGLWIRESWVFGHRLPDYPLKRIVKADLSRDPAYKDYLQVAGEESYLAVPKDESGD